MNADMPVLCLFFRICPVIVRWQRGWRMPIFFGCQKFSLRVLLSICLIFFSLALLMKVLLIRKKTLQWSVLQKSFPHIKGQPWYIHADQTFYSSFEGNCREIVNYSLPSRRNPPQKNLIPREKCPQKIAQENPRSQRITSKEYSYPSENLGCILGPIW